MFNGQWIGWGLSPQPLVSDRLVASTTAIATAAISAASGVSTGIAALAATTAVGGLLTIAAQQTLGIHKLGLLQELTT